MENVTATICAMNFLLGLRGKVHRVNGEVRHKSEPLPASKGAVETREIDLVLQFDLAIVGDNVESYREATPDQPMGSIGTGGNESLPGDKESWLHKIVKDRAPKRVLMIPGRGGQYPPHVQNVIQKAFSQHNVTWFFPELPVLPGTFFHDPATTIAFVEALIRQEILR